MNSENDDTSDRRLQHARQNISQREGEEQQAPPPPHRMTDSRGIVAGEPGDTNPSRRRRRRRLFNFSGDEEEKHEIKEISIVVGGNDFLHSNISHTSNSVRSDEDITTVHDGTITTAARRAPSTTISPQSIPRPSSPEVSAPRQTSRRLPSAQRTAALSRTISAQIEIEADRILTSQNFTKDKDDNATNGSNNSIQKIICFYCLLFILLLLIVGVVVGVGVSKIDDNKSNQNGNAGNNSSNATIAITANKTNATKITIRPINSTDTYSVNPMTTPTLSPTFKPP